jgi:hypothetical protein
MGFTTSVLDGYTLSAVCACRQVIEKSKAMVVEILFIKIFIN